MTLGTNASLEELIKYSPQEIDFDFLLAELKELEGWRELMGDDECSVDDVKERIVGHANDIADKDAQIENLEDELDDANNEIERLKEAIDHMISSD
jgi:archaellum component FlaC